MKDFSQKLSKNKIKNFILIAKSIIINFPIN